MTELVMIAGGVLLVVAVAVLSAYLGAERERRRAAERITRERMRDGEISSGPFVDRPLERMRPKK